ncbi:hypothetical protein D3C78_600480 [compost metagenome]
MGVGDIPGKLNSAIQQSHEVDIETAGSEGENLYYSFGWSNDKENRIISHMGSNPNYSSQVIINLEKQQAIFVLTNLNSTAPSQIADNLYSNLNGMPMNKFSYDDAYVLIDLIFSFLVIIAIVNLCLKIMKLTRGIELVINDEKTRVRKRIGSWVGLSLRIILLVLVIIWPYLINNNYYMLSVWMSYSLYIWMGLAAINCILAIVIHGQKLSKFEEVKWCNTLHYI